MPEPTLRITKGHPVARRARRVWAFLVINAPILMGVAGGSLLTLGVVGIVHNIIFKGCN